METKVCSKCGDELALTSEFFSKLSASKDGFRTQCKQCDQMMNLFLRRRKGSDLSAIHCDVCGVLVTQGTRGSKAHLCSKRCRDAHYRRDDEYKKWKSDYDKIYRVDNKKRREELFEVYSKTDRYAYLQKIGNIKYKGLTEDQYRFMLESQRNCCDLCGVFFDSETVKTTPNIDHNHDTGKVRALLCLPCNVGIGCLKDSSEVSMRAVTYLMKHGS